MARPIAMQHALIPGQRLAYEGYSWTTFFWGFFPALFRGDGFGFLIGLGVSVACLFIPWLPFIVWAAFYNQFHLDRLLSAGWYPVSGWRAPVIAVPTSVVALTAAPGWYPDPENSAGMRYWNGQRWTDDRR